MPNEPLCYYVCNGNVEGVDRPSIGDPLPWKMAECIKCGDIRIVDTREAQVDFDNEHTANFVAKAVNMYSRFVAQLQHTIEYLEAIGVSDGQQARNIRELLKEIC